MTPEYWKRREQVTAYVRDYLSRHDGQDTHSTAELIDAQRIAETGLQVERPAGKPQPHA